jgi:DNA polymerase-3 subunit delta
VVRDLDTLPPDAQRALADYLERGTPPVLAIFTARALDRRGRLFRALQAAGRIHPCDPLTWREVPAWLTREAARMGKRLTPGAVEALAAGSGAGLRALRLELEKLAAYVDDRPQITEEDVRAVGALESDPRLFALADAIGERHVRRATQLLQGILAREHPLPVLGMIARQFRLLVRAREAGRSQAAVARAAGVTPYVAGKLLRQVTRYGAEDFPAIFALLEEADRAIKSTGQPELALETLVVQLCAGPGRQGDTGAG